jgi:hypothetical protein
VVTHGGLRLRLIIFISLRIRMKALKFFVFSFIILSSIAAGVIYYAFSHIDDDIISVIEQAGNELTQAPVKVGSVNINPRYGSGSLTNLSIRNPAGFSNKTLYISNKIAFKVDPTAFKQSVKVINKIDVRDTYFYVERPDSGSQSGQSLTNIQTVASHLSSVNTSSSVVASNASRLSSAESKSDVMPVTIMAMVERITFADIQVELQMNTSDKAEGKKEGKKEVHSFTISGFFLENLGDKEVGLTLDVLGKIILQKLFAVVDAATQEEIYRLSQEADGTTAQDVLGELLQKTSSDNTITN